MLMLRIVRHIQQLMIAAVILLPAAASADLLESTNFRLDPNVASSFGGSGSSTSYKLTDTGGEAVVGAGSSISGIGTRIQASLIGEDVVITGHDNRPSTHRLIVGDESRIELQEG